MKKTICMCDKCMDEIELGDQTEMFGIDLCPKCSQVAADLIEKWINEPREEVKAEPDVNNKSKKKYQKVDEDVIMKLYNSGKSVDEIVEETEYCKKTINRIIKKFNDAHLLDTKSVIELRKEGKSLNEIAKETGLDRSKVYRQVLKAEGREKPKPEKPKLDYGKMKALFEGGWELKEIANEINCEVSDVEKYLTEVGCKL